MAMDKHEAMLAEAIKNALDDDALGLKNREDTKDEVSHTFTFLHEEIEQQFRLETSKLVHHDAIAAAFNRIHSYKYLNDPSFALSFKKDLTAQGIPMEECQKAMDAIDKVSKKLLGEAGEKDAGWHPELDEIKKVSQPEQFNESVEKCPKDNLDVERAFFADPKVRKWLGEDVNSPFWESVRQRILPLLEGTRVEGITPDKFWEAYDNPENDVQIRNEMHELYDETHAQYLTSG